MADVNALRVLVEKTVVPSSACWTAVTTATVSMVSAYVRRASAGRTAARQTASTTAGAAEAVWKMNASVMSHGLDLTAPKSSVQMTVTTVAGAIMARVSVMKDTLGKTVVIYPVLAIVTTMACA